MRRRLIALFFLAFSANAMSSQHTANICPQLPGLWLGSYTYKNVDDCRRTGACTHLLSTETKQLNQHVFEVDLSPPIERYRIIKITCDNGQITIPFETHPTITFTCEANKMCRVSYDDERLSAVANKIS